MNKLISEIIKTCEVVIRKLDVNAAFFNGTGYSGDEKKLMIKASKKLKKAVRADISNQFDGMLYNVASLIDQSQKMSIKKGEANVSEDDDKAMAVLMALIWMESSSIGATIARLNNGTFLSLTQSALIEFGYKGNAADAAEKLAESWKANYAGRIGEMLNANSKEMVKKVLADAIENNKGGNLPALLVAIKVGLESISERIDYRSQQIAQNEVLSTGNEGRYMAALIAGKRTKVWKTVGDSKVRDWHKAANGQTVAIGDYFIVNGERMLYPKDPNGSAANVVNCRCWAEYK